MATIFSFQPHSSLQTSLNAIPPNRPFGIYRIHCQGNNPPTDSPKNQESKPENAVLKVAWYGSELLGIAASFLRPPSDVETPVRPQELASDLSGAIRRPLIVETIKQDFGRSYFVTGNLTLEAYEEECEFADPAGSFKGLRRFKRNCTNFGSLVDKSNMKLTKWEDFDVSSPKGAVFFLLTELSVELLVVWTEYRTRALDIGSSVVSCRFLGDQFYLQLDIQSIILIQDLEKCAGMKNTGMFLKWLY